MDMQMHDNVRNRLNQYILERGVKCNFIASKCNICTARLSRFINNKKNINDDMVRRLNEFLKLNYK